MTVPYRNRSKYGTYQVSSGSGDPAFLINSSFEELERQIDVVLAFPANVSISEREAVGVKLYSLSGTVSLTAGSTTLTGSGTAFLTDLIPGAIVFLSSSSKYYVVSEILSDTSLTLTEANAGSTVSGSSFKVFRAYRAYWTDSIGNEYTNMAIGLAIETVASGQMTRIRTHGLM